MTDYPKLWYDIVESIEGGTAKSLDEILEDFDAPELFNNLDFCQFFDEHAFQCVGCGWMLNIDSISTADLNTEELVCTDCETEFMD